MNEQVSNLGVVGDVYITKICENGQVDEYHFKNLVVATGKTYIASRMSGATANVMSHMGIGEGISATSSSDTTLGSELVRVALSVTGGTPSANTVTYSTTFSAGTGTGAITEAGVFNGATGNTMLCRSVFPVVNKAAGDTLAISWVVSII